MLHNYYTDDQESHPNDSFNFSTYKTLHADLPSDTFFPSYSIDEITREPKKQIRRELMPMQKESLRDAKGGMDTIDLNRFPTGIFAIHMGSPVWIPRMRGRFKTQKKAASGAKKLFEEFKKKFGGNKINLFKDEPACFYGQMVLTKGKHAGILISIYSGIRNCMNLNLKETKDYCKNWHLSTNGELWELRKRIHQFFQKRRVVDDLLTWKESLKSTFLSGQMTPYIRSEEDVLKLLHETNICKEQYNAGTPRNYTEVNFYEFKQEDWQKYIDEGQELREVKSDYLTRQEFYDQYNVDGCLDPEVVSDSSELSDSDMCT